MGPVGDPPEPSVLAINIPCPLDGSKSVPFLRPRSCRKECGYAREPRQVVQFLNLPRTSEAWAVWGYRSPPSSLPQMKAGGWETRLLSVPLAALVLFP